MDNAMRKINLEDFNGIYKTLLIWILFLLLFYTLVGFLLVPQFARNKIIKSITEEFNKTAHIDNVSFNPFSFSFLINGFSLSDSTRGEIVKCREIYVNLEVIPLLNKEVDIETLNIYNSQLSLLKNRETFNFSNLLINKDTTAQKQSWTIFIKEFEALNFNLMVYNKTLESTEIIQFNDLNINLSKIRPQSSTSTSVDLDVVSLDNNEYKFTGIISNMLLQLELSSTQDTIITKLE
jgi:hypothetical protein